jgi:glucosamine kinase
MGTEGTMDLGINGGGIHCRARIEDENGRVFGKASAACRAEERN